MDTQNTNFRKKSVLRVRDNLYEVISTSDEYNIEYASHKSLRFQLYKGEKIPLQYKEINYQESDIIDFSLDENAVEINNRDLLVIPEFKPYQFYKAIHQQ